MKVFWIAGGVIIGGVLMYWASALYWAWQGNEVTRFFLPPYQSSDYFLLYVRRLFAPWIFSLVAGVSLAFVAHWLNCYCRDRFFEKGEAALLGLCFFLAGFPTFLWYGVAVLLIGFLLTGVYAAFHWGRAPLYYWWVPIAMSVIILEQYFIPESVRNLFAL